MVGMKSLSTSAFVLAAAVGLAACSSSSPSAGSHAAGTSSTTSTAGLSAQSTSSTSSAGAGASSSTSTTTPPETAAPGSPIKITSPANGAAVASPMTVSGTTSLHGQSIQLVLTDASGNVLCQSSAVPGANGSFSATMRFAGSGPGSLAAFVSGPGSARNDLIQVPLHLAD
jgi:cellulose 1,4-beta-cellobiosidase